MIYKQRKRLIMGIIFLTIGVWYLTIDYMSLEAPQEGYYRENWFAGKPPNFIPDRNFEFILGNGFMSGMETYMCFVLMLFGAMRIVDFVTKCENDTKVINNMNNKNNSGEHKNE